MPTILNLYWITCKVLILTLIATNSAPNTYVSAVCCFLEYQFISDIHVGFTPSPRPSSPFVTSMITVYKHT